MPVIKPAGECAPEVQLPKVIRLQEEALGQIKELKGGDVATLIKILDGDREKHLKLEEELLTQMEDLRKTKQGLEETLKAITIPNEGTIIPKTGIRIPALMMLFLLFLAALAGSLTTTLLLN